MSSTPAVATRGAELIAALHAVREPLWIVRGPDDRRGAVSGPSAGGLPVLASLPPLFPEWLGDRSFQERHQTRFPYIVGAMANGITTPRLVIAAAEAGGIGFFGAAGLSAERVEAGIDEIIAALGVDGAPWGANLIHSPNEPRLEAEVVGPAQVRLQRPRAHLSAPRGTCHESGRRPSMTPRGAAPVRC